MYKPSFPLVKLLSSSLHNFTLSPHPACQNTSEPFQVKSLESGESVSLFAGSVFESFYMNCVAAKRPVTSYFRCFRAECATSTCTEGYLPKGQLVMQDRTVRLRHVPEEVGEVVMHLGVVRKGPQTGSATNSDALRSDETHTVMIFPFVTPSFIRPVSSRFDANRFRRDFSRFIHVYARCKRHARLALRQPRCSTVRQKSLT